MTTIEEIIMEVEDNVALHYEEQDIDPRDIPSISVEEAIYHATLPSRNIDAYWDKLIKAAVDKYETLCEMEDF